MQTIRLLAFACVCVAAASGAKSPFEEKSHSTLRALVEGHSDAQVIRSVKNLPSSIRERLGLIADSEERFEVGCVIQDETVPRQRFLGAVKIPGVYYVAVEQGGVSYWWFIDQYTVDSDGKVISTKRVKPEHSAAKEKE